MMRMMYMLWIVDVVGDVDDVAEDEGNIMIHIMFVLQVRPASALRPSQTDLRPLQDHTIPTTLKCVCQDGTCNPHCPSLPTYDLQALKPACQHAATTLFAL